jgi:hypothetical protein
VCVCVCVCVIFFDFFFTISFLKALSHFHTINIVLYPHKSLILHTKNNELFSQFITVAIIGSWHVLFAVLCEDFESPKMVWNFSTLQHLTECLTAASKELDAERSIWYVHVQHVLLRSQILDLS